MVVRVPEKLTTALLPVTETPVARAWKPSAEMETMSPVDGAGITMEDVPGLIRLRVSEVLVSVGVVM